MHFATSSDALIPFHVVDVVFLILRNLGSSRRLVASVPMERRPRGIQDQYRKTTAKSKKLWFCNIIHNNNIVLYSLYMFVYARALLRTLVCVCIVHCRHALFVCVWAFIWLIVLVRVRVVMASVAAFPVWFWLCFSCGWCAQIRWALARRGVYKWVLWEGVHKYDGLLEGERINKMGIVW